MLVQAELKGPERNSETKAKKIKKLREVEVDTIPKRQSSLTNFFRRRVVAPQRSSSLTN